jgi:hypothetical protein
MNHKILATASPISKSAASIVNVAGSALIQLFLFQGTAYDEVFKLACTEALKKIADYNDSPLLKTIGQVADGLVLAASPLSIGWQAIAAGMWSEVPKIAVFGGLRYFGGTITQTLFEKYIATSLGPKAMQYGPWIKTFSDLMFRAATPIMSFKEGNMVYHWAGFTESKTLTTPQGATIHSQNHCRITIKDGVQKATLDTCDSQSFDMKALGNRTLTLMYKSEDGSQEIPVTIKWDGQETIWVESENEALKQKVTESLIQTHSVTYPQGQKDLYSHYETAIPIIEVAQKSQFDKNFPTWKNIHSKPTFKECTTQMLIEIKNRNPDYYAALVKDQTAMELIKKVGNNQIIWAALQLEGISSIVLGARAMGTISVEEDHLVRFIEIYLHAFDGVSPMTTREGIINTPIAEAITRQFYPELSLAEALEKLKDTDTPQEGSNEERLMQRCEGALFGLPPTWVQAYESSQDLRAQLERVSYGRTLPTILSITEKELEKNPDIQPEQVLSTVRRQLPIVHKISDSSLKQIIIDMMVMKVRWKPACLTPEARLTDSHSIQWIGRPGPESPRDTYFSQTTQWICTQAKAILRNWVKPILTSDSDVSAGRIYRPDRKVKLE